MNAVMKAVIPSIFTSSNLVFGMFSIYNTFHGDFLMAAYCVFFALIADGLDGRVARLLGASSEFGKELDSLCDMVSFGVAPAFMAYVYMLNTLGLAGGLVAAFFAVCGALGLARFNVNADVVKGYFVGMPIPTAGCVVSTLVMTGAKPNEWVFLIFVAFVAYLMISTIHYPDFKGKGADVIYPVPAVVSLGLGILIVIALSNSYLFAAFFAYSVFGVMNSLWPGLIKR